MRTIFELIDMRSFASLWFWIVLVVQWSVASHWVLGVPHGLLTRARRLGGQAQRDLEDMARIKVNRLLYTVHASGLWIAGGTAFLLTVLILLGFVYRVEFAQALLCLLLPMVPVGLLSLRTAHRIADGEHRGEALQTRLIRLHMAVQGIGMVAILATSFWGMYRIMQFGVLG
ncbi:MAG: component of SufBCD complex [Gemmobacter sp.]|nr:component of SufBCD complex [Gemmobacter sp.]